jgi:ATP-binding cassette subfamily B protein
MGVSEFSIPFRYKTNKANPVVWLLSHTLHHWAVFLAALLGAVGNAALASIPAIQFGIVFTNLTSGAPDKNVFIQAALVITFSQVLRGLFQLMRNLAFEVTAQRIERDVRDEFYISLLGKSMTFHSLQSVGDLMARATNDIREVNFLYSPGINMVFGSINFLFVPPIIAWQIHPALLLTPLLFILTYFIAVTAYLKKLRPITDKVRSSFGLMNSRLAEAIDGVETVKAAAQEENEIALFRRNIRAYRDASVEQGDIEARFLPLLLLALAMGFGLLHALVLFQQGTIPLGDVIKYFSALALLNFPTNSSIHSYSQISLGVASARRLLSIMNTENNLDKNDAGRAEPLRGEVRFTNLSFSYNTHNTALQNINFVVKPGQTVAIVGQTGSGKTTLVRLINRTYDPSEGSVQIDGCDLRDWRLDTLRSQISIIEQDIFLFSTSIADNIAFSKPGASRAEVEAAARKAQAHAFITALPEAYDTFIGERGVTLSGGQRQRIALARAFLTDPKILILDDSTSAIDSQTEDEIQRAIKAASEGRTTFIITHRLSQIRWADLIIVMRRGTISDIGTHTELMQSSASYRNIFTES